MSKRWRHRILPAFVAMSALCLVWPQTDASGLRGRIERLRERRAEGANTQVTLPPDVRAVGDVAYGPDPRQRFDVYFSGKTKGAPVILLVHGGGWAHGDKAMRNVIENKVTRWVPAGYVVISTAYRMLPDAMPDVQAADVAKALAEAQRQARTWGGDPERFVLMGHSAGAHLVALLSAAPRMAMQAGAKPWRGAILLDSGALDVEQIMRKRHARLFDRAFGSEPSYWRSVSPQQALTAQAIPMLVVCSSQRRESCGQAHDFVAKAASLGDRASVQEVALSHGELNQQLGLESPYTRSVEGFMRGVDAAPETRSRR